MTGLQTLVTSRFVVLVPLVYDCFGFPLRSTRIGSCTQELFAEVQCCFATMLLIFGGQLFAIFITEICAFLPQMSFAWRVTLPGFYWLFANQAHARRIPETGRQLVSSHVAHRSKDETLQDLLDLTEDNQCPHSDRRKSADPLGHKVCG